MEVCPFPLNNYLNYFIKFCWVSRIAYLALLSGQVLRHENLSDYIKLKVPSLKTFSAVQANGNGISSPLRLLAHVMQKIKR